MSLDSAGNFRWFDQTYDTTGRVQYGPPNHALAMHYQPTTGYHMVCGSFAETNTELFDHGALSTTSQTNAYVCPVHDAGNYVQFSIKGPDGNADAYYKSNSYEPGIKC
ncbi:MAG: hypothetical protein U5L96_15250 [Owenweeksia sp.]|nr:hypothetical protein [Owenweeksia sp.]